MKVSKGKTNRGFRLRRFADSYGYGCSIQKSSLATADAIWFGVDDPKPQVMASRAADFGVTTDQTTGWVPYPIPADVLLHTRMHLTRAEVRRLLPILQAFVDTGDVP